nr:WAS/WASL-interacting protein family member 3-like [Penaeus vannamei]
MAVPPDRPTPPDTDRPPPTPLGRRHRRRHSAASQPRGDRSPFLSSAMRASPPLLISAQLVTQGQGGGQGDGPPATKATRLPSLASRAGPVAGHSRRSLTACLLHRITASLRHQGHPSGLEGPRHSRRREGRGAVASRRRAAPLIQGAPVGITGQLLVAVHYAVVPSCPRALAALEPRSPLAPVPPRCPSCPCVPACPRALAPLAALPPGIRLLSYPHCRPSTLPLCPLHLPLPSSTLPLSCPLCASWAMSLALLPWGMSLALLPSCPGGCPLPSCPFALWNALVLVPWRPLQTLAFAPSYPLERALPSCQMEYPLVLPLPFGAAAQTRMLLSTSTKGVAKVYMSINTLENILISINGLISMSKQKLRPQLPCVR